MFKYVWIIRNIRKKLNQKQIKIINKKIYKDVHIIHNFKKTVIIIIVKKK